MSGKSEIRNPKSEKGARPEIRRAARREGPWLLGLQNPDFLRIPRFGFRISLLFLLATCLVARAQETNSTSRLDYVSFRIISERNIFNPNRSGRFDRSSRRDRDSERRVRTESFALVGTMSYEKGRFAFFDGTSSDYRKVLEPEGTIASYKVAEIASDHVRLQSTNRQDIELRVGMQMRKQEEGEWRLATNGELFESPSPPATPNEKTDSGSGGEADDILKRLMQKREQELKNEKP